MAKTCPVNFQKVDENKIRFQALFVALTALAFVMSGSLFVALLLFYDFIARLLISQSISPFSQITFGIIKIFNIPERLVDSAPKIFASQIGFAFSFAIMATALLGASELAVFFAIILAICALLDALLNYCVGCKCYAILHNFNIV